MVRAKKNPRKQQQIEGTEAPTHTDVDEIAAAYVEVLYERKSLQDREPALKAQLFERIKGHDLPSYKYEDGDFVYTFTLESKEKLTCKRSEAGE